MKLAESHNTTLSNFFIWFILDTIESLFKGPSMRTSDEYSQYATRLFFNNLESSAAYTFQEKNSKSFKIQRKQNYR